VPTLGLQGVAFALVSGPEFRSDEFMGYYEALLHRPPRPGEVQQLLAAGLDAWSARARIESGPEFFSNG
jgi:hypothetical protein